MFLYYFLERLFTYPSDHLPVLAEGKIWVNYFSQALIIILFSLFLFLSNIIY